MRVAWMVVGVAWALSGCPSAVCPAQLHTVPRVALDQQRAATAAVKVIRAEARVDQRSRKGRIKGKVMMFVQRPDRVRFDVMSQFGPVAVLTSDGERFALMDLKDNRYLTGPTCPSNIARMLGIRLSSQEVARVLLGDTPRIEAADEQMQCRDGAYEVDRRAADGRRQRVVLAVPDSDQALPPDRQRLRVARSELYGADGKLQWRVTFEAYRSVGNSGVEMPRSVHFEDLVRGEDTLVRFTEIDANVAVPDEVFTQSERPGMVVEEVHCD